ncbi:TRAP transporter substrate-binding protein DctP [Phaeobacter gallaeciensis]|jgi:TRAP-type C4-dicarboxylate transport system substrate-binding protein|uniref:TRAP transporter substrate-binding protein DctP n=1 Tax=Phaeobacter gallaeciensis TaxID=60890 RepID=UPI001A266C61|nr:TRAP transporter substrate-binding protein DctP [Phaeobacter gallaeciensis]MBK0328859.1 TRAP transporter substrate-binding protein DctP [Rhodobacteraceae bacterium F11138]MDE4063542.1 TRAP transporter substrate-binding protein DctP [Phaeobacter gallaeciensis]MDE4126676.1 TRAP transporter substrate-binding protein DctP [Phaeobacter gallaeciensis]MDE4131039.1 TRAP transporter substrate-binding protein DctP [Phaeobacter gallaeciensis]|tara:strand:- start:8293 stop:9333 length:1041 start_codon:yes stop_codon:yes gene_type:complete
MRNFMISGALALTAGLAMPGKAAAAENILFNCFFPPRHYVCTDFLPELGQRIETATEGRVKLRTPPKTLAAPPDQMDAVANGVMDGAVQFNGFLRAQVPGIQFSMLPFVGNADAEATSVALWETYQKHFADKEEYGETVLLALFALNGGDIFSVTDEPIVAVDDLAKRKIWSVPGVTANVVAETGSSVVSGPAVQMLEVVSKGVVDGYVGMPQSEVTQYKLTGYTKSATIFDEKVFQATFSFFVSRDKWEAISEEDRTAIHAALGSDFSRWMGAFQDDIFERAHQEMGEEGVTFIEGSDAFLADLKTLGAPQIEAWKAQVGEMGVDGQAVLDDYRKAHDAALTAGQ